MWVSRRNVCPVVFKTFKGWKTIPPSLELWSVSCIRLSPPLSSSSYHHHQCTCVWVRVWMVNVHSLRNSKVKPQPYVHIYIYYIKWVFFFIQVALWEIGAFLILINPLPNVRSRGYGCMCVFTRFFLRYYYYIVTVLLLIDYIINIYIYNNVSLVK